MGKSHLIKTFLITVFVLTCSVITVHAEDENGNDETNNLGLDTEILKNKKEDANSTSTVGEYELFSSDFSRKVDVENAKEINYYTNLEASVFNVNLDENTTRNDKVENNLFNEEIKFDKNISDDENTTSYFYIILSIITIVLLIFIYIFTRKKYVKHDEGGDNNANNYNF